MEAEGLFSLPAPMLAPGIVRHRLICQTTRAKSLRSGTAPMPYSIYREYRNIEGFVMRFLLMLEGGTGNGSFVVRLTRCA
jgi:hypothetical protein